MEIKEIRKLTGLSQKGFAEKYGIPVRSIENWESSNPREKRQCPGYLLHLLERVVREDFNCPTASENE